MNDKNKMVKDFYLMFLNFRSICNKSKSFNHYQFYIEELEREMGPAFPRVFIRTLSDYNLFFQKSRLSDKYYVTAEDLRSITLLLVRELVDFVYLNDSNMRNENSIVVKKLHQNLLSIKALIKGPYCENIGFNFKCFSLSTLYKYLPGFAITPLFIRLAAKRKILFKPLYQKNELGEDMYCIDEEDSKNLTPKMVLDMLEYIYPSREIDSKKSIEKVLVPRNPKSEGVLKYYRKLIQIKRKYEQHMFDISSFTLRDFNYNFRGLVPDLFIERLIRRNVFFRRLEGKKDSRGVPMYYLNKDEVLNLSFESVAHMLDVAFPIKKAITLEVPIDTKVTAMITTNSPELSCGGRLLSDTTTDYVKVREGYYKSKLAALEDELGYPLVAKPLVDLLIAYPSHRDLIWKAYTLGKTLK